MKLTRHFSRIKANGAFLHEEGMNVPPQREATLEDRPYSNEEVNKLFYDKYNMPDPVTYKGDEYYFTGKMGKSFKDLKVLSFEYSDHGEDMEQRIWVDIHGKITPD
jgi:hypothetical protein